MYGGVIFALFPLATFGGMTLRLPRLIPLLLLISLCTCDRAPRSTTAPEREKPALTVTGYAAGIELGSTGPRASLIATGTLPDGRVGYEVLHQPVAQSDGVYYPDDGRLNPAEIADIVARVDTLITALDAHRRPDSIYLVQSIAYRGLEGADTLRATLRARHPRLRIDQLTPELEARANFLTMQGRIDLPFDDFVLIDIGGSSAIMSVYDPARADTATVLSFPYGSRNLLATVDPLSDLTLRRMDEQIRLEELVRELTENDLKGALRRPAFAHHQKVVFVGGLVYKIIRVLDVPLTGTLIDFSRSADGDPVYRFRETVMSGTAAELDPGPDYTREELWSALEMLDLLRDEMSDRESVFFFERPSWLPGYVLARLQANKDRD